MGLKKLTVSKTVDRIPLFSKNWAQIRPDMPPPITATTGSSDIGAVNLTCSWMKLFFKTDLLEVPYDDFLLGFFLFIGPHFVIRVLWFGVNKRPEDLRGWTINGDESMKLLKVLLIFAANFGAK